MKYLISILFLLFSFTVNAQSVELRTYEFNFWQLYVDENTEISFYYLVRANTDTSKDNLFYYDVYFFNNTYCDLDPNCATYISDVSLRVKTLGVSGWSESLLDLPYVLVTPANKSSNGVHHIAYIYTQVPLRSVKISWEKLDIY